MREQHYIRGVNLKGHESYNPAQWRQKLGKWTDFWSITAETIKGIPLEERQEIASELLSSLDRVPRMRKTQVRMYITLLESSTDILDNLIQSRGNS